MQQDVAKYIENPLHGFSMIKRATTDLSLIMERLPSEQADKLKNHRITESSLVHAVKCLLLLQRIYKLRTRDIARGIVNSRRIGDKLTPYDLYVIGNIASNLTREEFFAREYYELALEKTKEGHSKLNEINESNLLMKIAQLCERMHDYRCAALNLKELMMNDPHNVGAATYALRIAQLFQANTDAKIKFDDPFGGGEKIERNGRFTRYKEFELISDVCRGKLNRNAIEISKLHCFFITASSYSKIAPFKVELVNLDPYILLYHDVLSSNEIQSAKMLLQTQKMNEKSTQDVIGKASLFDSENELASRISRRIEVN
jgi:prolyl 4-hydroxylase